MPSPPTSGTALATVVLAVLAPPASAQDEPQSWRLAMGYLQRGMHAEARDQLKSFLGERPRDARRAEALYRLGTCEIELGHVDAAIAAFEAALSDRELSLRPECLYRLAGALQHAGRFADARPRYDELVAAIPADHYLVAPAQFGAGESARDAHDDRAAARHFLAAASATGDTDPAGYRFAGLYQAGYALLRSGDAEDAATAFATLLEAFPRHEARGELWHLLGEASLRAGHAERAEAAWKNAIASGGDFVDDARSGIAWSLRQRGESAPALRAFRELLRENPQSEFAPAARVEVGRLLLESGAPDDAKRELESVIGDRSTPDELKRSALEVLGLALLDAGDADGARQALERAAAGAPADAEPRIRYAIAECDAARGRFEDALSGYDASARTEDAALRGDALYGKVMALHALGRHAESAQAAEQLAAQRPAHRLAPYAEFAIAENLFAQQRFVDARARFDALGADHPLSAEARSKAAWCSWQAGLAADARARFAALADDDGVAVEMRSEALSMAALAALSAGDPDAALEFADTYRARFPNGGEVARTARVAARVLKERGDLSGAAERLARAARAENDGPAGVEVALERADLLFAGGDFRGAARAYTEHAKRSDAFGMRAIEGLAWCAFELGEDADCARWIDAGVAQAGGTDVAAALRELRVTLHHRAGEWSEARDAARDFLANHAAHARAPEVRFALGVALARGGDLPAARAELDALAKAGTATRPDRVQYELGWTCRKLDDPAAARAAFVEAARVSTAPDLADECRIAAAEIDLEHGARVAARELLGAVEHRDFRARAAYLTGQSWLADEDLGQACAAFDSVVALGDAEPLFADALFAAGESAHRLRRFDDAAARLERFLDRPAAGPRALRARLLLGECLVELGRPADAVGQLTAFVAASGAEDAAVRARGQLWLGRAQQDRGAAADAESAFAKAAELSQGEIAAEAWFRTGEVRRASGDQAGAADAFVRVSILYAHDTWVPRALLEAGRCFEQLGRRDQAQRLWRELVERYGTSEQAKAVSDKVRGGER